MVSHNIGSDYYETLKPTLIPVKYKLKDEMDV